MTLPFHEEMSRGLKEHFGLSHFRPGQAEVVSSVLSGRNTVVVMPTGAGKSLCFQLPAVLLDGVTLVVSPLIALMQDQVEALTARGISATFINSTLTDAERHERQRRLKAGAYKLVYVAPERLRSESFLAALAGTPLACYAIDEAHCISQWGHDFRPEYAQLGQVRKRLRPPRTVALTATATPEVREDIARVLLMKEPHIFVAGFDRPNLFLEVVPVAGEAEKRRACEALAAEGGSGIVYCSTRKQAEGLCEHLKGQGVEAFLYHAGMDDDARREAQEGFMRAERGVAVATNAFGMGIDKPDIRFVAHAAIPRAVEAYYQEVGRAGRDGQPSRAVLLFNHADVFTQERLIRVSHPPATLFRDVWSVLRQGDTFQRGVHLLAAQVGASEMEVSAVLKVLEREGALSRGLRGEGRWTVTLSPGASAQHPRQAEARAALQALAGTAAEGQRAQVEVSSLARRSGLDEERLKHGLHLLEKAGLATVVRPFSGRTISVSSQATWEELGLNLERVREQEATALLLLKRMTDYAYGKRCRRGFLLRYFGEEGASGGQPCGGCDVCEGPRLAIPAARPQDARAGPTGATRPERYSEAAAEGLKRWRRELAADLGVPPFIIFNDKTLYALAAALPVSRLEFLAVKGTGESRWERFGPKVVAICQAARAAGDVPLEPAAPAPRKRRARA